ncbi:hypothetical protein FD754_022843, partial [Muntiacus muntjak]
MEHHIEVMKSKMHIFRGKMLRRTLLPIPTIAGNIDLDQKYSETSVCRLEPNERRVLHAIESVVIKWSHQIQEIIEKDSVQPLLNGLHSNPQTELDFWTMRRENLSCIYDQLQTPVVLKMVKILKNKQSSYFPTLKDIFMAVKNALLEAQDVELYLRPLRRHIQCLQETEFPQTGVLIAPLFHTICLIWSHSKFYNTPARIIVLLQEFCNLFVDQAIAYLSPEDLLKGEIEDCLEKVQGAINILKTFKNCFFNYRRGLASYFKGNKKLKPWDFRSYLVFHRFDKFLDRIQKIEDIFVTILEFEKLERLEFGGTKGAILNGQICEMSEEFMKQWNIFKQSTYDPSDYNNMEFESDYAEFKSKILDFDRRLGTILCEAFFNCNGLEAAFKLLTVFGNFLEKPVVMEIFSPHYSTLVHMFSAELDMCKQLYNEHMRQIEQGNVVLNKNMPFASGNIKWAKEVLDRLQMFWSNFASLHYLFLGSPDDTLVYQKYVEMTTLLNQFEDHIYNEWKSNVNEICEFNLNQPLVKFSAISGLLSVNFDSKLVAVLREVKYLLMLKKSDIPDSAFAIFKKRNTLLKYIGNLELLVHGYNKLKQTLLEVEYPLIEDELRTVDEELQAAATSLTWQDDCWGDIERVRMATSELERRVERAQNNIRVIQQTMRSWAECPLLPRREHRRETALTWEDKSELFTKKYKRIQEDGCKIHSLVEENRKLFRANPSLDAWKIYVEFIDDIVVEGFFQAIMHDLDFFLKNTEKQLKPAPFFQAQMILMPPEILFKPSLEREAGDGFYDLVEEMLCSSFRMSAQMKRVAAHLEIENYQSDVDNMLGLAEGRQEIMRRVADVTSKVLDFRNTLDMYAYLWVEDRAEFMKQFLLYGPTVSAEEMESHVNEEVPEQSPTLEQFKEQIDIYEALYVQMSKFDDFRVFDSWFKVDMKPFKVSLLNIIRKWSWMFQEHLLRFVIDSLNELQEFIKETDAGLRRELSEGDHDGLVDIMGHLLAVRSRQRATDELFEPLKETITLLEMYGQKMPEQVYTQLKELPERWETTKKIAATVRHEVSPLQNAEVTLIRKACVLFDEKQAEFRERFRFYAPLRFNAENPYTVLDKANQELEALEEEMLQMQESTHLFEVALPEYKQMKQCRKEIKLLKGLWDVIIYVRRSIDNWTKTQWRQINVEQMEVELRRFAKEIWSLDKEVRVWDAYSGLESTVKDTMTSLRAVAELQSPALRDRHWHQLMTAIGVKFSINEATTLADLLALQLHQVEETVQSIVDKAVKELGTEKVITEISQTWATMEFSYEVHYRTGIPLLKFDELLFETLEHNQVQLQTLLQSKYVEYFIEQVISWQNKLNTADSVIFTWIEVQCTWSHLESIFVCSEDIRIQLVKDVQRFDRVDAEFKELMFRTAKIKNVLEATCELHLYEKLKDLQYRLSLCEKALAQYLETKRLAFPRFYFISSTDLLDILSKGTQPTQYTCIPSLLDLPPTPPPRSAHLGHHRALGWAPCLLYLFTFPPIGNRKCLFRSSAHFFIGLFVVLLLSCMSYILEINPLFALFSNIFSYSESCLFCLFMVSFVVQKLLSLTSFIVSCLTHRSLIHFEFIFVYSIHLLQAPEGSVSGSPAPLTGQVKGQRLGKQSSALKPHEDRGSLQNGSQAKPSCILFHYQNQFQATRHRFPVSAFCANILNVLPPLVPYDLKDLSVLEELICFVFLHLLCDDEKPLLWQLRLQFSKLTRSGNIHTQKWRDFADSPVVRAPCFHCREHGFDLWQEKKTDIKDGYGFDYLAVTSTHLQLNTKEWKLLFSSNLNSMGRVSGSETLAFFLMYSEVGQLYMYPFPLCKYGRVCMSVLIYQFIPPFPFPPVSTCPFSMSVSLHFDNIDSSNPRTWYIFPSVCVIFDFFLQCRFIYRHFILFDVVVKKGIVTLIFLSDILLLIYRNTRDFCVLILFLNAPFDLEDFSSLTRFYFFSNLDSFYLFIYFFSDCNVNYYVCVNSEVFTMLRMTLRLCQVLCELLLISFLKRTKTIFNFLGFSVSVLNIYLQFFISLYFYNQEEASVSNFFIFCKIKDLSKDPTSKEEFKFCVNTESRRKSSVFIGGGGGGIPCCDCLLKDLVNLYFKKISLQRWLVVHLLSLPSSKLFYHPDIKPHAHQEVTT